MIEIVGTVRYEHAFTAKFKFGTTEVFLSVVFFRGVAHLLLPDDKTIFWEIVKMQDTFLEFCKRLKPDTYRLQFMINYGNTAESIDGQTVNEVEHDKAGPVTQSSSQYSLPFGSR